MRVLVAHNRYRSTMPSGENRVVDLEITALREAGHEVTTYLRSSDELAIMPFAAKVKLAGSPISSRSAVRDVRDIFAAASPEILHLHNPYPLISLSVVRAAREAGVAVVHTVHNHRHTCMKGTYLRDGRECRDCLRAGNPAPGVLHACYRDSRPQSAVMAAALVRHRSTYDLVDRFIALTPEFAASLVARGIEASRIIVKPNAVPDPGPPAPPGEGFLYVGRLSEEKGVIALLHAWLRHPPGALGMLRIAGDGPKRAELERLAAGRDDIEFVGLVDAARVQRLLAASAVVVVPSVWPEPFGLVVLEAMAAGRALIVTDQGALPLVVDDEVGQVVAATVDALDTALQLFASRRDLVERRGKAGRGRYERLYHPAVVTEQLVEVYREAVRRAA